MNYQEAMGRAKTEGTNQRNKLKRTARIVTWGIGALVILSLFIWQPSGPLQSYARWSKEEEQQSEKASTSKSVIICPDVSAHQTRSCLATDTNWTNWFKIGDGQESNGMRMCFGQGVVHERKDENGTTFWRFKAKSGKVNVEYRLFRAEACPAQMPK